jgi:hypothetical protein
MMSVTVIGDLTIGSLVTPFTVVIGLIAVKNAVRLNKIKRGEVEGQQLGLFERERAHA